MHDHEFLFDNALSSSHALDFTEFSFENDRIGHYALKANA
jgi:hypothetical protein